MMKPNYFIREQWTKLTSGGTCTFQFPPQGVGGENAQHYLGIQENFQKLIILLKLSFLPPLYWFIIGAEESGLVQFGEG